MRQRVEILLSTTLDPAFSAEMENLRFHQDMTNAVATFLRRHFGDDDLSVELAFIEWGDPEFS